MNYPVGSNEKERLRALNDLGVMHTRPDPVLDRATHLARKMFGVDMAAVTLLGEREQCLLAPSSIEVHSTPREDAFCNWTILADDVFVVEDATLEPWFQTNPFVTGDPHIRFYAGAPLSLEPGLRLGALCLIDSNPRSFSEADKEQLADLAALVVGQLRLHQQQQENLRSREFLAQTEQIAKVGGFELDLLTEHVRWSDNTFRLYGLEPGSVAPDLATIRSFYSPEQQAKLLRTMAGIRSGELETFEVELEITTRRGERRWTCSSARIDRNEAGEAVKLVGATKDVTDMKRAKDRVWRAANQDALTGLANRALFQERLQLSLLQAAKQGTTVSLLLVDLDDFKDVNDTLGHDAGDALLQEAAGRLQEFTREADTVARLGGDEFALVLGEPFTADQALSLARQIGARLSEPATHGDRSVVSRASIGMAVFPEHHREAKELLKDADLALYRAKTMGGARVEVYTPELRSAAERRVFVAAEMRQALEESRIVPFYQPKVSLATGQIVGFEALARWQHPTKGLLTPGYFSSVFDDPILAVLIGETMSSQMAADVRSWLDAGFDPGRVAFNLSSAEFANPRLANELLACLGQSGVPMLHFEVEVTETVFLGRSAQQVARTLGVLHDAGVAVALDDFGTGFASLSHLKQFPVDHLKIDQSFVRNIENDKGDAAIVEAILGLAHNLGKKVTAEGVETAGQAQRLRAMNCHDAQGFFYAKPTIGSRIPWLLSSWVPQNTTPQKRASVR